MVERFNGIVKRECLKIEKFEDINSLEIALNNYLTFYNKEREHGSIIKENRKLHLKTPIQVADYYNEIK